MKKMLHKRTDGGFSLIELLIVVAIIGIVASIAIPNLLASRRSANEGSAQSSLRTIQSCELTYQATTGRGEYGTLAQLNGEFLTDSVLGSGSKSGYTFAATPTTSTATTAPLFRATAFPTIASGIPQTGTRKFCITETGVMSRMASALATAMTRAECDAAANVLGN